MTELNDELRKWYENILLKCGYRNKISGVLDGEVDFESSRKLSIWYIK